MDSTKSPISESRTQFIVKEGRIEVWCENQIAGIIVPMESDYGITFHSERTVKPVPGIKPKRMDLFFL